MSHREVACGAATTNPRHCAGGPFPLLTTVTTRALALAHKYSRVPVAFRGRWLIEQGGNTTCSTLGQCERTDYNCVSVILHLALPCA